MKRKLNTYYIYHWFRYMPWFFREAPVRKWPTFFASAHRVAHNSSLAHRLLQEETNVFERKSLWLTIRERVTGS